MFLPKQITLQQCVHHVVFRLRQWVGYTGQVSTETVPYYYYYYYYYIITSQSTENTARFHYKYQSVNAIYCKKSRKYIKLYQQNADILVLNLRLYTLKTRL